MWQGVRKFYFVRHGETEANQRNLAAGCGWDVDLNETGLAQARALAASAKMEFCREVRTICVSPMSRARQTAEALNQVLSVEMVIVEEFKEWDLGDWERQSWSDLPNLFHPGSNPPNGESQLQFGARVAWGLNSAFRQEGPIMIVAHGGVWHCIARILNVPGGSIDNCDLRCVVKESTFSRWRLEPI